MKVQSYDWSVDQFIRLHKKGLLVVIKDYSWDNTEKADFIRLSSHAIDFPPFYFIKDTQGCYHVLDILNGKRRMNAYLEQKHTEDLNLLVAHFRVCVLTNPTTEEINLLKSVLG